MWDTGLLMCGGGIWEEDFIDECLYGDLEYAMLDTTGLTMLEILRELKRIPTHEDISLILSPDKELVRLPSTNGSIHLVGFMCGFSLDRSLQGTPSEGIDVTFRRVDFDNVGISVRIGRPIIISLKGLSRRGLEVNPYVYVAIRGDSHPYKHPSCDDCDSTLGCEFIDIK